MNNKKRKNAAAPPPNNRKQKDRNKKQKATKITTTVAKVTPTATNCAICDVKLDGTPTTRPLAQPKKLKDKRTCCLGCYRSSEVEKDPVEVAKMVKYIHDSTLDEEPVVGISEENVLKRLEVKLSRIKARSKRPEFDTRSFDTIEDLYDLLKESGQKCKALNAKVFFHHTDKRQPFWAVSYDHIIPFSRDPEVDFIWSKSNFQLLLHCMNHVKADDDDDEFLRWL